jgi:hypothetical protein
VTPTPERIAPELTERLPLDQLLPFAGNARRGGRALIREFLLQHGQVEALVVNRGTHTGRVNEIIAGNNRHAVMAELGWADAAVTALSLWTCRRRSGDQHTRHDTDTSPPPVDGVGPVRVRCFTR